MQETIHPNESREKRQNDEDIYSRHIDGGFGENKPSLPIRRVDEVIEEAGDGPDWLIEDLLARGAVTDFAGLAKKGGKTTFWCHAIKACTKGEDHCGFATKPAKFLYLTEQGNNFAEVLRESGLADHPGNIRIVQLKDVHSLKWNHLVKAAGGAHRLGFDALILDTFAVLADLKSGEENDSAVITEKMRPLQLVAQTYNLAAVLIRHSGKDGTARGSSAFEGIANICVTIARPEGRHANTVRRLDAVGHYGEWQLNVDLQNGRYVSLGSDNKVEFNRAVRFVRAVLPTTPGMKKADLLDKRQGDDEDIAARTIDRALAWLVEQRDVGEKQLMDERGKPKVYWLAYKPDNGATNGSNVHSRQTISISNEFGENKYDERHSQDGRDSQHRLATLARSEEKEGVVVQLQPDNLSSSLDEPASAGPSGAAHGTPRHEQNDVVGEMLRKPPDWLATELRLCLAEPTRLPVNKVATHIATEIYGSPWRWREVVPVLREHLADGGAA